MARTAESYSLEELDRHDRIVTELRIANRRLEHLEQRPDRGGGQVFPMLMAIFSLVFLVYLMVRDLSQTEEPAEE